MHKYLIIFLQTFSQYISYRLQIILNLLLGFLTPGLMLLALSHAQAGSAISVSGLLPYYLVIAFVYPITTSIADQEMDEMAEKGDLYQFLLRPLSLYKWLFAKNISEQLVPVLFILPVLITVLLILPGTNILLSPISLFIFLISLFLSFVLSFNLSYFLGLFCFWIDEFWAIGNLKFVIISFLSGSVLPYTFFPLWLSHTLSYTPFPYLASWLPKVLKGQIVFTDYLIILFWILFFSFIIQKLEHLAIKHYSYVGG